MGKTTYIRDAFDPDASLYIDLLEPEIEDAYRRTPRRLENQVRTLPDAVNWVLIDEVQRAPRLLDMVHRLIESTRQAFHAYRVERQEAQAWCVEPSGGEGVRVQSLPAHSAGTGRLIRYRRCAALGNAAVESIRCM